MKENQNAISHESKSFKRDTDPLTFGSKEIYESDENGTISSPRIDDENGLSHDLSGRAKDADALISDVYDEDKKQISPEHENSVTVKEFAQFNENKNQDSSSQRNGTSDLFETVTNVFTDKNVLECEMPELEVMKDICVDDGMPEKDKKLTQNFEDDKSGHLLHQDPNEDIHCDILHASSLEKANSYSAGQCGSKEENEGKLVDQESLKSSSVISSEQDTAKRCDPEELVQMGEANCAAINTSENDSLIDKELSIQEYSEEHKPTQPADQLQQIPIKNPVPENPAAPSPKTGELDEDIQAGSLLFISNLENKNITSNFSDGGQVQSPKSSTESANSKVQRVSSKNSGDEDSHEQTSAQTKDGNSDDYSSDGQVQFSSNNSQCSTNDDEPNVAKQERGNLSGDDVVANQLQYEQGETSFSAVTYSGPIAFSGSISHRSDASTTSTRSFAFPVLQSEWNSSPVRMAKADRRHFRKQKGWRSGLLCCRF